MKKAIKIPKGTKSCLWQSLQAVAACVSPQSLRVCPLAMAVARAPLPAVNLVLSALLLLAAGLWHFLVDAVLETFDRTSLVVLLQGLGLGLGFPLVAAGTGP